MNPALPSGILESWRKSGVKLITRDTDYALRALCFIAKNKKRVSVPELVAALNIPRPFLRKLLQSLEHGGLARSYRGAGGGFELARAANKIFLLDVMAIFQGPFSLNECFLKKRLCPDIKICGLKKRVDGIERYIINQLKGVNLACLLR